MFTVHFTNLGEAHAVAFGAEYRAAKLRDVERDERFSDEQRKLAGDLADEIDKGIDSIQRAIGEI